MNAQPYFTPSQRYYRGEISLQEATEQELRLIREERKSAYPSVFFTWLSKTATLVVLPFVVLVGLLRRN
jgi:hypothetical protein